MRVLLSSASFAAGYGGPASSVLNLARYLSDVGLDVAIWSPDGTAASAVEAIGFGGKRLRVLTGRLNSAISDFPDPDIFHDSGIWWRHNIAISSAARSLGLPYIISTRGMLEPAALDHHRWRKWIAWYIYQKRIVSGAAALHVTGELEEKNVKLLNLPTNIVLIPNGIEVPEPAPNQFLRTSKRMAFLGRLHPIKGLSLLLEAWSIVKPNNWHLEIAGPDEGSERIKLLKLVKDFGLQDTVSFTGSVYGLDKEIFFRRTSVFVLPSLSENFGLAIGEALARGVPAIATHGSPWSALQREACGWYVPASVAGLKSGIERAIATADDDLAIMGQRGYAYVSREFRWSNIADRMIEFYKNVIKHHVG